MTISKTRPLCSLKFASGPDYDANLDQLCSLIEQTPNNALIVAPEVCLTNFDYERFDAAAAFTAQALTRLIPLCQERIVILTVIEQRDGDYYNVAKVLHGGRVIFERAKCHLFRLGKEHYYFNAGDEEEVVTFEVEGCTIGLLICFELRFKALWQRLEGADVIAIPAQWGRLRGEHFVVLTEALAVMNQCYVVASDSANENTSGEGGIVSPFGDAHRNGNTACLNVPYEERTVQRMRRYLDVGIS